MPGYAYIARDERGRKVRGELEAENERAVVLRLRPRRLTPISIKKKSALTGIGGKDISSISIFKPRVKTRDIVIAFRQFATLINAGLPMVQSLDILIEQTQNLTLRETCIKVREDVKAGVYLSDAFSRHPKRFSPLICNLVKAGETGGALDEILLRLANYLEDAENIKNRIKGAMRYPVFVLFMAGGLSVALLFFILPSMEELFREGFGVELPAFTKFVLDLSRFLREQFYILPLIIAAIYLGYLALKKTKKGAYWLDSLKLKIPVLGKLFHRISLSRFSRTLATLSNSGVPILEALSLTGKAAGNKIVERAAEESREAMREGETIAAPLKKYPIFPPLAVSMISVGEKTGNLDTMLNKIADLYDDEVKRMVDSLTSLIEPLLIAFLGGTVGIIVIAMYLPYFTMFQHIGG
ncbi:type II secretion system F family protein [Candidatus Aerophobetes bacterium]|nr:type II secretion system F family protein [Candidatus Aerophobetes bacterium]